MPIASPYPDVSIPDTALTPFVLQRALELGDKPALIDGPSGRTLTHAQLEGAVRSFAGGLRARGFEKGDTLGILLPNVPEYAVAWHGTAFAGGTVTTVNPLYNADEIGHQLRDAAARFLIVFPQALENARKAAEGSGVEEIFVLGDAEGATPVTALLGEPLDEQVSVDPGDTVALPYSSGTTGLPKGVMLSHRNLVANILQARATLTIEEDDVVIGVLPFFHIYGMTVIMNMGLHAGATTVTMPRFDLEQFLTVIQDHKVTRAYVVPPIALALAKHPLVDRYDLSSLRLVLSGAAPLGAELEKACADRLGCAVIQGYGMTETSPVTHTVPIDRPKPGTIGPALPNTECRIVDAGTGEDAPQGERGELLIRGPQVMQGYLNNEQATRATIDEDGWLHTGDVAVVDEDGFFAIVDRVKELIKYKGFQVAPAELEALIMEHPGVADAAVIPVPDEEAGEIPKAFVVLQDDDTSPEDVQRFVADRVSSYKQIRAIEVVDEIPKSASGKILRRVLRDREQARA
ncbi:MAG TPA: 4-coumarate--CoA ligase family protein [Solirubrobacteraceae bacterium]|nr:4-coumarate--CoA ligase family protein [Solirubrobacteraceae bacterium]